MYKIKPNRFLFRPGLGAGRRWGSYKAFPDLVDCGAIILLLTQCIQRLSVFKIWSPGNPTCNVCCIAQQCKTDACTLQKITLLLLCQRLYHYITQAAASTHSTQMILLLFTQLIFLVLRRLSSDDDCDGARLCSWVVKWWRRSVQRDVVVDDTDCTHTHTHRRRRDVLCGSFTVTRQHCPARCDTTRRVIADSLKMQFPKIVLIQPSVALCSCSYLTK